MKSLIGILVSISILSVIIYKIGTKEFVHDFKNLDPLFLVLSILLIVPQILVSAVRWRLILEMHCPISLGKATSVILASSSLNAVLPTKFGDFAKAVFHKTDGLELTKGIYLTIIEKALDFAALSLVLLIGALLVPHHTNIIIIAILFSIMVIGITVFIFCFDVRKLAPYVKNSKIRRVNFDVLLIRWHELMVKQKDCKRNLISIISLSVLFWYLYMAQVYLLFLSFHTSVSLVVILALVPISIYISLLPISFGGLGTREASLIYLFSSYAPASIMASIGILLSLRYFVPALIGIPFLHSLGFSSKSEKDELSEEPKKSDAAL